MEEYNREFFLAQREDSYKLGCALLPILRRDFRFKSIIDIGCGAGGFLKSAADHGYSDILGVDGEHVSSDILYIPADKFKQQNLELSLEINRRFDLLVCLEVVEHLSKRRADNFVSELCKISDTILFSAAIPMQGGTGHINERWLEYWASLFLRNRFVCIDTIRNKIWNKLDVPWWYRQNVVVFIAEHRIRFRPWIKTTKFPKSRVHPELFIWNSTAPHCRSNAEFAKQIGEYRELAKSDLLSSDGGEPNQSTYTNGL